MEHKEKKFFPLFVDFTQKRAVVIGGGKIAVRRIQTLLTFVGEITVIALLPRLRPRLAQAMENRETPLTFRFVLRLRFPPSV